MNPFQKLLNEYIDAKDITIYALAKISGIERSFVQKIKKIMKTDFKPIVGLEPTTYALRMRCSTR